MGRDQGPLYLFFGNIIERGTEAREVIAVQGDVNFTGFPLFLPKTGSGTPFVRMY